ncbi:MAG: Na+/H+ antiporter NhaA [Chloroflexi bacterium]|nr:Na+/H+ antiporter NhaA [Chloroflexota bacterium]
MAFTSRELATRRARIEHFVRPVQSFTHTEAASGIVLLLATAQALIWANSPWSDLYHDLLDHRLGFDLGFYAVSKSFHAVVNDGAMAVFFFVVGLEIKREIAVGELRTVRRLIVPLGAALGGVVVPALLFLAIAGGQASERAGWGIPIATDIAFALGVLALLGPRIGSGLKTLLLAVAIVDDIAAIVVIGVFYSSSVTLAPLAIALGMVVLALLAQQIGLWWVPLYAVFGIIAWFAVLESGIHPTIVGVVFGLITPWRAWYRAEGFTDLAAGLLDRVRRLDLAATEGEAAHERRTDALFSLSSLSFSSLSPLDRLERELHPFVAFGIVPLFALTNAGVALSGDAVSTAASSTLAWGIAVGLLLGKPVGIVLGTWVIVRVFRARLPAGVTWSSLVGLGLLGGIGFTVSLFITELAFADETLRTSAKLGILVASLASGLAGYAWLRVFTGRRPHSGIFDKS